MPRLIASLFLVGFAASLRAAPPDFDTQIAPLLASHCLDCHRGAKPKGDLDLSKKAGVLGKDGSVVPGKPAESTLWERVAADEMPPKKPLAAAEKKLLKDWIESGAKWGTDPIDPFRITTNTRAGYDWWSLQPVKKPSAPRSNLEHPIDAFVAAKLSDKALSLSPPADKRTQIRRVTFDLTGLPPTPEEVAAFEKDDSPAAFSKVVDRLLASPHYGERWARHWLDVVRYGETDGFERNAPRPNSWHYRDWVIRALNSDMPYDRFAKMQLAGDVLQPNDADAVRATGYLVAAVHNTVLGNDQMRAVARQDELEDLVGAVGQTFLGLTVNCARCHDHKFDPISQMDYYRLVATLAGVNHGERPLPDEKLATEVKRAEADLAAATKELATIEEPARQAILAARGKGNAKGVPPAAIAAWDFRTGPEDLVGKMHAKAVGGARFTATGAVFDGKTGFARTAPLGADLRSKTLEAWATLDSLEQRGGGVITLETPDGNEFDAIVFGENEAKKWMAGSNGFVRTKPFGGGLETAAGPIHFAITYSADGSITGYRDGKPYGTAYRSNGPLAYKSGSAVVAFGIRHEPAGGNRMLAGTVHAARLYDRVLTKDEVAASFSAGPQFATEAEIVAKLTAEQRSERTVMKAKHARLMTEREALRSRSTGLVYANISQKPPPVRFLHRGQVETPGETVSPRGLPALAATKFEFQLPADASDADRRVKLAEWITSPNNPLFSRVMVNRVWHHHFGTGLVETPSDFGFNGGRPSHPELLDWLAADFATDYSLKRLHKLIVTSTTYRQASTPRKDALAVDADNRLLWRMKPRRLEGEAVRDSMLAVSGLLNREVGGKGFSDYKERNFNGTAYYDPFDPDSPEAQRRSIYRFTPRGGNTGLLDAFDCPDPAAAAPRRAITTTPLQALSLWNGGFALRVSGAFADRVAKEHPGDVAKQVTRAWRLAFGREPTTAERALAEKLVADHGLKALTRSLFNANEFLVVE
jgi:hypothetical protein